MCVTPGEILQRECSRAQHLVFIAAPYIKSGTLKRVLSCISPQITLTCVTQWNPHDIAAGATDIDSYAIVKEHGGSFRLYPSLHAKYYRMDDVCYVGSANVTEAGLGWATQSNVEIICEPGEDFDATRFQISLIEGSREVEDVEASQWKTLTGYTFPNEYGRTDVRPRLSHWRPATRDPRHLAMVYRGRTVDVAAADEQRAASSDLKALMVPAGLSEEEVRIWIASWLLSVPFVSSVLQTRHEELPVAARVLSENYDLGITEARRDMETVFNWLAFFFRDLLT